MAEIELHVATLRDRHGVLQRVRGHVPERTLELLRRLHVELVGLEPHPAFRADHLPRLQAEQDVVHPGVLALEIVAVVRGHERRIRLPGEVDDLGVRPVLFGQPVVLDLQKEPAVREDLLVLLDGLRGPLLPFLGEQDRDLPLQARRGGDDPLRVLPKDLLVDAGPVVEPLDVRPRHQLDEVPVPFVRFGEQDQVVRPVLARGRLAVVAGAGGQVELGADDGLDPLPVRLLVEVHRADHSPVVGQRHGGHPHPGDLAHELLDLDRPVEEAVLGMEVQVDELLQRRLLGIGRFRRLARGHSHSIVLGGLEEMS